MAVKWDGFTDEDIKKLKSKVNDTADMTRKESSPLVIQKRATLTVAARRSCDRLVSTPVTAHPYTETTGACIGTGTGTSAGTGIPEQARLSLTSKVPGETERNGCSTIAAAAAAVEAVATVEAVAASGTSTSKPSPDGKHDDGSRGPNGEALTLNLLAPAPPFTVSRPRSLASALMAPGLAAPPLQSIDINDFEARQKMIEEQNRLKKVFLSKALEDRKKQASAEAKRLNMIQEELQRLDQRLSGDVSIIRNQIESASIEFLEAQKRYDRAEKEFLEAKMLFFTKLERKELLTHHLCTIIEQNEMRKAQKLSELMEKLDLRAQQLPENSSQNCEKPNIPKLSAEVILSPTEAGRTGNDTGTGIGIGTGSSSPDSVPDAIASSSTNKGSQASVETSK